MLARVKQEHPHNIVQAHTGLEFIKSEWRHAPDDDAPCIFLEYKEDEPPVPPVDEYADMTDKDIRNMAKELNVWKRGMSRDEMITAVNE